MKITIINSKGHWRNGWLTTPSELGGVIRVLRKAGIRVHSTEVETVTQLEKTLDGIPADTLVWTNAYYVNDGKGGVVWLNDYVEARGFPLIGSGAQTLKNLLRKDVCQSILEAASIPIPPSVVITADQIREVETIIRESEIGFPMVLKPTAESGSVGISMAKDLKEANREAEYIIKTFPQSDVILETFLPSDDVTCGFLELGDELLFLPTYYIVKSAAGKSHILSRKERLRNWEGEDKIQLCIREASILTQLKTHIPTIIKTLRIREITRIDGRLDPNGTLRFFDINGLPALSFPDSVMVEQCFSCFPNYSREAVFESLINTIVYNALLRHDMKVPEVMKAHNLFTMDSEVVIKTDKIQQKENPKIERAKPRKWEVQL